MSYRVSDVRLELVQRIKTASGGRADGLGEALVLIDAFLRAEAEGKPVKARSIAEITRAVASIAHA